MSGQRREMSGGLGVRKHRNACQLQRPHPAHRHPRIYQDMKGTERECAV